MQKHLIESAARKDLSGGFFNSLKMRYLFYFLPAMLLVAGVLTVVLAGLSHQSIEQQYRQQTLQQLSHHTEYLRMIILGGRQGELESSLRTITEKLNLEKICLYDNNGLLLASYSVSTGDSEFSVENEFPLLIQNSINQTEEWKLKLNMKSNPFISLVDSFVIYQLLIVLIIVIGSVIGTFLAFDLMVGRPVNCLKSSIISLINGKNDCFIESYWQDELGEVLDLFNQHIKNRQTEIDRLLEFSLQAGITCFFLTLPEEKFEFTGNLAETLGIGDYRVKTIGDLYNLVHPDQRITAREKWSDLKERIQRDDKGRHEFDLKLFNSKDDYSGRIDEIWIRVVIDWNSSDSDKVISGVIKNVSQARRQENELNALAERFRKINENCPVGIWRSQADRFVYMNQEMAGILGYSSPDEAIEAIKSISHEVYLSQVDRTFFYDELKKRDQVKNLELKFKRANGSFFWGALFGRLYQDRNLQYCEGCLIDITERKHFDERLRANEEFLRQGLESAGMVLWQLEPVSGQLQLRGAVEGLLGKNIAEQITLKDFQKLIHPDDFGRFITGIDKLRHSDRGLVVEKNRFEFRICRVSENQKVNIRWLIAVAGPSDIISGGRSGMLRGIFIDITSQKETEEKLLQVIDAAKGESRGKSEFFATMSHEVRTPLNAIIGFSELLVPIVENQKGKNYVSAIISASRSLINTINSILDLSRLESGKIEIVLEPVRIEEIIADIRQAFVLETEMKGIEFIASVDENVPQVLILDEFRVRQVITNLLSNAVKFTSSGSIGLRVSTSPVPAKQTVYLTITVEDTGIGLHVDDLQDLFKPFAQKKGHKSVPGNAGLGLAICDRLVDLMGGKIKVKSELQCGSRFDVILKDIQIADPEVTLATPRIKERQHYQFNGQRILIADDTASNRELMSEAMRSAGLQVICAVDGQEAVEMAVDEKPELIFMDLKMPRKDGVTAARELKSMQLHSTVPIIAVTASTSAREERELGSLFDGFINKPVSLVRLFSEAGRFLKHGMEAAPLPVEKLILPPEAFEQLSEPWKLVDRISTVFMPRMQELEGALVIEDARRLTESLKQLSVKHSFNHLTLEVENLSSCVENFDLPGIDNCRNRIIQIFQQILLVYSRGKTE